MGGARRLPLGKLLVVAQMGLSLAIMIVAALLVRSVGNLKTHDLGFRRDHLLIVWTQPSSTGRSGDALKQLWYDVQERLGAIPGVVSASASNGAVLSGEIPTDARTGVRIYVEGQPPKITTLPGGRTFILPKFFQTLGVPLLAGREFTAQDTETAPPVVIINEAMTRTHFGSENPVGRRVGFAAPDKTPIEVVGVVKDFEAWTPRAMNRPVLRTFFPYRDREAASRLVVMCAILRTHGDPLALAARVREEIHDIEPRLAVLRINTVDEQLDDVLARDRLIAGLATFFSSVVGLLCCLGLYGLIAHMVSRRTSEIGLRLALGATRRAVVQLVLTDGMVLIGVGLALGLSASFATTRLISAQLFKISAADPLTIAVATVVLTLFALLAGYLPARRASCVDPLVALKSE
jgi:putative ABC transport system permease protein